MASERPTWDEMRATMPYRGTVGSLWHGLYAAKPGSGLEGSTCKTCDFAKRHNGQWSKCDHPSVVRLHTASRNTDIKLSAPACSKYANAADPAPAATEGE